MIKGWYSGDARWTLHEGRLGSDRRLQAFEMIPLRSCPIKTFLMAWPEKGVFSRHQSWTKKTSWMFMLGLLSKTRTNRTHLKNGRKALYSTASTWLQLGTCLSSSSLGCLGGESWKNSKGTGWILAIHLRRCWKIHQQLDSWTNSYTISYTRWQISWFLPSKP